MKPLEKCSFIGIAVMGVAGLGLGGAVGWTHGILTAILGAIAGGIVGLFVGLYLIHVIMLFAKEILWAINMRQRAKQKEADKNK